MMPSDEMSVGRLFYMSTLCGSQTLTKELFRSKLSIRIHRSALDQIVFSSIPCFVSRSVRIATFHLLTKFNTIYITASLHEHSILTICA